MDKVVGAADFLGAMFGDSCGKDRRIVIWTMPDKRTQFFSDADDAAEYAMMRADDSDVYFGVGLYRPGIERGRGKASDVVALPALWGDVDYGEHTSGKKLPPTKQEALKVIDHCGVKPTAIVHSGHGFHAYWFLKEPLEPDDKMVDIARVWQGTLAACAKYHGYTIDSVGDVSRVLRVPGTFNRKGKNPLAVQVEKFELYRYDVSDLESSFACEAYNTTRDDSTPVDAIAVNAGVNPDAKLLTASVENNPIFKRTWEKRRGPDLHDHSPSGYDLSLASQAVGMGWSDQQIANLLIAFRRTHGHDLKKTARRDYLQNTIARAKKGRETDVAVTAIETIADRGDGDKGGILTNLRRALRLPIERWVQHGVDRALYSLVLEGGQEIVIGRTENVQNQRLFRGRIYEVTGDMPPMIRSNLWDGVMRGLGVIREIIENPERSIKGLGEDIIAGYVQIYTVATGDGWHQAVKHKMPFVKHLVKPSKSVPKPGDYLHVSLAMLKQYCKRALDDKYSMDDLTSMLWLIHFRECRVTSRKAGAAQRYWRRPCDDTTDESGVHQK